MKEEKHFIPSSLWVMKDGHKIDDIEEPP